MLRLTSGSYAKTTRKHFAAAQIFLAILLGGCSTPGVNHLYLTSAAHPGELRDIANDHEPETAVPDLLRPWEGVMGFAYDPYTDHIFLRLTPGTPFCVVDRPAGKVKQRFTASSLPLGPGDLAIRSANRHLFVADNRTAAVFELTINGEFVRKISLDSTGGPPRGLALDQRSDELLVLTIADGIPARVTRFDFRGRLHGSVPLDQPVAAGDLSYDSDAREYYARLAAEPAIGVFDSQGHLTRRVPFESGENPAVVHFDVGPRSLVRLF